MSIPKFSDEEFIRAWELSGGSAIEVAKMMGLQVRGVQERRRRIEERTKKPLLCLSHKSPDIDLVDNWSEFPDIVSLEIKDGLLVVGSDFHYWPDIVSTAHRAMVRLVKEMEPKAVIANGDILDFPAISRHHRIGWDKTPNPAQEIEVAVARLHELKTAGPKAMVTKRTMGNHDQRFEGKVSNVLPQYEGIKGLQISDHLQDWPLSYKVIVNGEQLAVTHRWKGGMHGPANNALWSGISYCTGHMHKAQVYPITDMRGDRWGVDTGCVASIYGPQFRYMEAKPRNWRSAFGVFRFVNYQLRQPELIRVVDEKMGLIEFRGHDIYV
jgi:hypothetical protein